MRSCLFLLTPAAMAVAAMATPAHAQLDLNLGGVGVSVGGGSGVNVSVDGPGNLDVSVGLGGSGGSDGDLPGSTAPAENPTGTSSSSGGGNAGATAAPVALSQDEQLAAVKSRRVVPLAPIVADLQQLDLKVVDAQLISVRDILLYEVRVIGASGDVSEVYFYARSGRRVVAN
jgi:hypothetical protein